MQKKIKLLVTGAGAPGIAGTIFSLRNNYDNRDLHIVTTDSKTDVAGKYISDDFYQILPASQQDLYLESLYNVCRKQNIQIIIPQNTAELLPLSSNKKLFRDIGTEILLSDSSAIKRANNKYELMKVCTENDIPTGKFFLADNFEDLYHFAIEIGWPEKKVVVKPPDSNGMRGVRIIDEKINLKELFYKDKPSSLFLKIDDLKTILGDEFPQLIVTEYLPGMEYTVDMLRSDNVSYVIPRTRDEIRTGITFKGKVENNYDITRFSETIAEKLNLKYCFGFQFKLDENGIPKILESNPRIQGTMIMSTLAGANIIYTGVKILLGEPVPELKINWSTKFFRLWGGISDSNQGIQKLNI